MSPEDTGRIELNSPTLNNCHSYTGFRFLPSTRWISKSNTDMELSGEVRFGEKDFVQVSLQSLDCSLKLNLVILSAFL